MLYAVTLIAPIRKTGVPAILASRIHRLHELPHVIVIHLRHDNEERGKSNRQSHDVQYAGGKETPERMRKVTDESFHCLRLLIHLFPYFQIVGVTYAYTVFADAGMVGRATQHHFAHPV